MHRRNKWMVWRCCAVKQHLIAFDVLQNAQTIFILFIFVVVALMIVSFVLVEVDFRVEVNAVARMIATIEQLFAIRFFASSTVSFCHRFFFIAIFNIGELWWWRTCMRMKRKQRLDDLLMKMREKKTSQWHTKSKSIRFNENGPTNQLWSWWRVCVSVSCVKDFRPSEMRSYVERLNWMQTFSMRFSRRFLRCVSRTLACWIFIFDSHEWTIWFENAISFWLFLFHEFHAVVMSREIQCIKDNAIVSFTFLFSMRNYSVKQWQNKWICFWMQRQIMAWKIEKKKYKEIGFQWPIFMLRFLHSNEWCTSHRRRNKVNSKVWPKSTDPIFFLCSIAYDAIASSGQNKKQNDKKKSQRNEKRQFQLCTDMPIDNVKHRIMRLQLICLIIKSALNVSWLASHQLIFRLRQFVFDFVWACEMAYTHNCVSRIHTNWQSIENLIAFTSLFSIFVSNWHRDWIENDWNVHFSAKDDTCCSINDVLIVEIEMTIEMNISSLMIILCVTILNSNFVDDRRCFLWIVFLVYFPQSDFMPFIIFRMWFIFVFLFLSFNFVFVSIVLFRFDQKRLFYHWIQNSKVTVCNFPNCWACNNVTSSYNHFFSFVSVRFFSF